MRASIIVKRIVKSMLARAGLELRRVRRPNGRAPVGEDRESFAVGLRRVRALGWAPKSCIDVGAAFGSFTLQCARVFPEAHYLLVEPLQEYRPFLEKVAAGLPRARYAPVAGAAHSGQVTVNVHADLVGSSLLRESEGAKTDGVARVLPARTIDDLCRTYDFGGPYLLKVDVQGAELQVLEGARTVLSATDYVMLEVSLFRFFIDGPEVVDVIAFMRSNGFVPYDVFHLMYRPLDGALAQFDLAFVKENGPFRQLHVYATPEQRRAQDARFAKKAARVGVDPANRRRPA